MVRNIAIVNVQEVGGIVKLKKGDIMYVKVGKRRRIVYETVSPP